MGNGLKVPTAPVRVVKLVRLLGALPTVAALLSAPAKSDDIAGLECTEPNSGVPTLGTPNLDDSSTNAWGGASTCGGGVTVICGSEVVIACVGPG